MTPVSQRNHTIKSHRSIEANTTSSKNLNDRQLRIMGAPKRVNALQWELSTPEERRDLMEAGQSSIKGGSDITLDQVNETQLKTRVINQGFQEQLILEDSVSDGLLAKAQLTNTVQQQAVAEQKALNNITTEFKQTFTENASNKTAFHDLMQKSFGAQYDVSKAETMRQQSLKGDFSWMPKVQLVNTSQLKDISGTQGEGVGRGAYSQSKDTIYLNRQLLNSNLAMAEKILTEEVGHSIDAKINVKDAKGDEGDIFSRLSHGEKIDTEELKGLKTENDNGIIEINGEKIEVEYGFLKKLRKKIKRAVRKVTRSVKKAVKKVGGKIRKSFKRIGRGFRSFGRGITRGLKKIGKGIKKVGQGIIDAHKKIARGIKKGYKKLIQSKLFNKLMMVAQFIPIPVVQLVVRGVNVARAAYSVYQGVKNKSWSAVLGGVASIAGGVGKVGELVGASAKLITKAAKIAKYAQGASVTYQAIANKDFAAAAGFAANYFGGDSNITKFIRQVPKIEMIKAASKKGDYLGAIGLGANVLQDFSNNKSLIKISRHTNIIKNIERAVKSSDYASAAALLVENYGDGLGVSQRDRKNIIRTANTFKQLQETKELIDNRQYERAAQLLLNTSRNYTQDPKTIEQINNASRTVRQVDQTVKAVNEGRYDVAINLAADVLGKPLDNKTRTYLTSIQTIATESSVIRKLIKSKQYETAADRINNLLDSVGTTPELSSIAKSLKKALDQAKQANEVYKAKQKGDYLGAIGLGANLLQDFTDVKADKFLGKVSQNTAVIKRVEIALDKGNYGVAASILTENYADNIKLSSGKQQTFKDIGRIYEQLKVTQQKIDSHQYEEAAQILLKAARSTTSNPGATQRLENAGKIIKQVDQTVKLVKAGRYDEAITLAADTLGKPLDTKTQKLVKNLQKYADNSRDIVELIKAGKYQEAIEKIRDLIGSTGGLPDIQKTVGSTEKLEVLLTRLQKKSLQAPLNVSQNNLVSGVLLPHEAAILREKKINFSFLAATLTISDSFGKGIKAIKAVGSTAYKRNPRSAYKAIKQTYKAMKEVFEGANFAGEDGYINAKKFVSDIDPATLTNTQRQLYNRLATDMSEIGLFESTKSKASLSRLQASITSNSLMTKTMKQYSGSTQQLLSLLNDAVSVSEDSLRITTELEQQRDTELTGLNINDPQYFEKQSEILVKYQELGEQWATNSKASANLLDVVLSDVSNRDGLLDRLNGVPAANEIVGLTMEVNILVKDLQDRGISSDLQEIMSQVNEYDNPANIFQLNTNYAVNDAGLLARELIQ